MRQGPGIRLTPRETEVLAFLLQGYGNKLIAAELGLAEQSVKDHVSALLAKFGVANRAALAVEAGTPLAVTGELGIDRSWIPQLFLEAEPQICILRGPELRYEAANESFRRATGGRPIVGRMMRDAFPEIADQGIYERVERVYRTGKPEVHHEHTSSWDRGEGIESRTIELILQPLRAEDGAVNGVLSFAFDVTEQVGARDRAEIVCDEVAAILDLVPNGVIVTDERGLIVKANAEAARIARTPLDPTRSIDDQGVAIFRIRDASGRRLAVHELPVARALKGETLRSEPYVFDGGDPSREIRVRTSAKPIRAADGRIRGAALVFTESDEA